MRARADTQALRASIGFGEWQLRFWHRHWSLGLTTAEMVNPISLVVWLADEQTLSTPVWVLFVGSERFLCAHSPIRENTLVASVNSVSFVSSRNSADQGVEVDARF